MRTNEWALKGVRDGGAGWALCQLMAALCLAMAVLSIGHRAEPVAVCESVRVAGRCR